MHSSDAPRSTFRVAREKTCRAIFEALFSEPNIWRRSRCAGLAESYASCKFTPAITIAPCRYERLAAVACGFGRCPAVQRGGKRFDFAIGTQRRPRRPRL